MRNNFFRKLSGQCGEDAAVSYLKKNKYKIIERNYRCKAGEIDIIAKKDEDLVFVEVKTRSSDAFGTPSEAVTYYKKRHIITAAKWYLTKNPTDLNISFDIIEVYGCFSGEKFELQKINHFKQVFKEV